MIRIYLLPCILCLVTSFARADMVVFAAASLKGPLDQIAGQFDDLVVSYGGSGTLARQVGLGAPADLVLLANVAWMDVLVDQGTVDVISVQDFASNRLVVIAQAGHAQLVLEPSRLSGALGDGRLAVGLTKAVPAGIYAKTALQALGLWETTQNHLAEVDSVRAALALVARGQVPLGIVYGSDVRVSAAVTQVAMFPQESHPPIRYVGALVAEPADDARAFWDYLRGPKGQAVLAGAGFLPPVDNGQ